LPFLPPRAIPSPEARNQAAIQVEQTHGPILLISGDDDGVWMSRAMSDAIVSRLKSAHFQYPVEHLKYSHAGHGAGHPEIVPAWHGPERHPISGKLIDRGGTVAGNAESSIDAAPKVIEFLRQNLKPKS
jgi:hypothetical protein